jgi:hypothetical protein
VECRSKKAALEITQSTSIIKPQLNWARAQSAIGEKSNSKINNAPTGGFFRTASTHVKFSEKELF